MTATIALPRPQPHNEWLARLRTIGLGLGGRGVMGLGLGRSSVGAAANGLLNSLEAYWTLDSTPNDSKSANNLTVVGGMTYAAGKIGNAANTASGKYLTLNDNAALSAGDTDFTIALWCYATSLTAYAGRLFSKRQAATNGCYDLYHNPVIKRFELDIRDASGTSVQVNATNHGEVSTGTWYHVVAWHNSTANTLNIAVNNGTPNSWPTGAVVPNDSTAQLRIGDLQQTGSREWLGYIDEVGFWRRVLSADDRTALYNGGVGLAYAAFTT